MRTPNTSCDIYITATPGIDAPDISNVPCWIGGQFDTGAGLAGSRRYSAMLEAPLDCGLRDNYNGGASITIFTPDVDGEGFFVVFVERDRTHGAANFLRAFLSKRGTEQPVNPVT